MKYSSRFFLYAPLGVFLVLLAVVGIRWWVMADALSDRLAAANGHEIMPGVTMRFAARSITGFPFSLDAQFRNVSFTLATPSGATRWQSEKFASHALTYGRDETIFEAAGHQNLDWTGPDGRSHALAFAVGALRASAIARDGELIRFDLDLVGFGAKAFTAQRLQLHARQSARDRIDVKAMLEAPRPAAGQCALLGERVAQIEIAAAIDEAATFGPLLGGKQDWQSAVGQMHRMGGGVRALDVTLAPAKGANTPSKDIRKNLAAIPAETLFEITPLTAALCGG